MIALLLVSIALTLFVSLNASSTNGDLLWKAEIDKCTAIIVGKKAGKEGPMTTHTADSSDCDFRLNKVPAMDFKEKEKRPLYLYKGSEFTHNKGTKDLN